MKFVIENAYESNSKFNDILSLPSQLQIDVYHHGHSDAKCRNNAHTASLIENGTTHNKFIS